MDEEARAGPNVWETSRFLKKSTTANHTLRVLQNSIHIHTHIKKKSVFGELICENMVGFQSGTVVGAVIMALLPHNKKVQGKIPASEVCKKHILRHF